MVRGMKLIVPVALVVAGMSVRAEDPPGQPFDDATFLKVAAMDGMQEIELGKIAAAQTKNADVKKFSEQIVKDHTAIAEQLKAVAKVTSVQVPDKLDDKHQKHVDFFKNYKGSNFDTDFAKHMISDHEQAVNLFTKASREAKNPEITAFAKKYLPIMQGHYEAAKRLAK